MKRLVVLLMIIGVSAILLLGSVGCEDDEEPTGSTVMDSLPLAAAKCAGDCVKMFSETCKWLFYTPMKIAGMQEVPTEVVFYSPDPPDTGNYSFFTDFNGDGTYEYAVTGDVMAPPTGWTGGLYNGDVIRYEWHCKRWGTLDTVGTGTFALVMLSNDAYRFTLSEETNLRSTLGCDVEMTSLDIRYALSNDHDASDFVLPFGTIEFAGEYEGYTMTFLVVLPSTGQTATGSGSVGSRNVDFTIDLKTFLVALQ